jgi:drug/metabolite transporter (DMT)-like permease
LRRYFLLIIPSLFDLAATALCMLGLLHVEVSIYQMLRGSAIIFVAILKHFVLKDKLRKFMWIGVGWNVVSIILVGAVAIMSADGEAGDDGKKPMLGVSLIIAGALVQSLQYVQPQKRSGREERASVRTTCASGAGERQQPASLARAERVNSPLLLRRVESAGERQQPASLARAERVNNNPLLLRELSG